MAKDKVAYQLMIIGGSAGSLDMIFRIVASLPPVSNMFYVIVVHRRNSNDSILVDLLSARTTRRVKEIEDKEQIMRDTIYIAPSDYHVLFEDQQTFALDSSEKIHFSRPSIDVSFESAAEIFGDRCIGILLSGANADGAEGLAAIKAAGGFAMVQSPDSSEVGFMPQQAMNLITVDAILDSNNVIRLSIISAPLHRDVEVLVSLRGFLESLLQFQKHFLYIVLFYIIRIPGIGNQLAAFTYLSLFSNAIICI